MAVAVNKDPVTEDDGRQPMTMKLKNQLNRRPKCGRIDGREERKT
jgi:hypothetical protein